MGQVLHKVHAVERPAEEAQARAADAANAAAIRPAKIVTTLAYMVRKEMQRNTSEPTCLADVMEVIGDRVAARFDALPDTAENQALIEVLYDLSEAIEQARLKFVQLDALCEGVTL